MNINSMPSLGKPTNDNQVSVYRTSKPGGFFSSNQIFYSYKSGKVWKHVKKQKDFSEFNALFESFAKYSTKSDPSINFKEMQGVIKDLSKYSTSNLMAEYDYLSYKQDIIQQMQIATDPKSIGGDKITVEEQRNILDAWCEHFRRFIDN